MEIWNVTAQGLHLLKEQNSCNLSFLYSISGGQRKSWIWCPTFSSILFTIRKKFKLGRETRCEYYQNRIWEEMFIEHEEISEHWTMMFLFDTLYNPCFVWIPVSINEDKQIFKGSFSKILKIISQHEAVSRKLMYVWYDLFYLNLGQIWFYDALL